MSARAHATPRVDVADRGARRQRRAHRRRVVVVVVVVGRGRGAASGVDTVRGETLRRPRLARDRRRRAYCSPDFRRRLSIWR